MKQTETTQTMPEYDIAIIGGGPGGYVAAIRAGQLGLKTVLIEEQKLGGVCLNWGCIPTKAMLHSAKILKMMQKAHEFGITGAENVKPDIKQIVARAQAISSRLANNIGYLMKKNGVDTLKGFATLSGREHGHKPEQADRLEQPDRKGQGNYVLAIAEQQQSSVTQHISARNVIIATGAKPRHIGIFPEAWTYKEALSPHKIPASMLVIGGGVIGIEFASFYAALGTKVTVLEMRENILVTEDAEVVAFIRKKLQQDGVRFLTSGTIIEHNRVVSASSEHDHSAAPASRYLLKIQTADTKDKNKTTMHEVDVEQILVSVGIEGNVVGLGLEAFSRIEIVNSHIVTDNFCATGHPGIFAIGDVAGPPWLAHKASHEGIACVEKIAENMSLLDHNGHKIHAVPVDASKIPGCIFSVPEIASIGLSEEKALGLGYEINVGKFNFAGNGKAVAIGESDGFIKTIFDKNSGEMLGMHAVGYNVTEFIANAALAMTAELTEEEWIHTVFPHPTISEAMHESVLGAWARALHA